MARKKTKSEEPKKIKPISLNILEIAKRLQKLEQTAGGGGDTSALANKSDIATEFNTTTAYTAGCFVYHDGKLYQFNADHAAGAWDPTDVVVANVTDQVVSNKSAIDALGDMVVANPTGEATATLTSIEIDGTKYSIGGGGGTVYLDHGQIGQADPEEYITNCPLDENLTAGKAIAITITDGQYVYTELEYYAGGTVIYNIGGFSLYVYSDHVGLPDYSGSYRDIYCDIVGI